MRSFYSLAAGVSLHSLLVASTGPVVDLGYARYEGVANTSLGYDTSSTLTFILLQGPYFKSSSTNHNGPVSTHGSAFATHRTLRVNCAFKHHSPSKQRMATLPPKLWMPQSQARYAFKEIQPGSPHSKGRSLRTHLVSKTAYYSTFSLPRSPRHRSFLSWFKYMVADTPSLTRVSLRDML